MHQIVLVRYDEIALKKQPVRGRFEKILIQNISQLLTGTKSKIRRKRGRILIETPRSEEVAKRATRVPGVASTSPASQTSASLEKIQDLAVDVVENLLRGEGTFAVRARRTGSHDFTSQDVSEEVGSKILERIPSLSVDLDNPDQELFVEVRGDKAYIFTEKLGGVGGLPVGAQEDSVAIFQGDQASFTAILLMLKRGSLVHPLFLNPKSGEEDSLKNQVIDTANQLTNFHSDLKLKIAPFNHITSKISRETPKKLMGIINWRTALRFAERIASKLGAKAIITGGESVQNSSWTLSDLRMIEEAVEIPVLRPLIGFENGEIGGIINRMGGFDFPESSNPVYPEVISQNLGEIKIKKIREIEESLSIDTLLKQALQNVETHTLG
ncbi:hypothetical protein AKJ47_02630 [candidate division MSBL1 archaeon SCGC-AAA261G05]|uniref:Probable tRNA sulfurtransferase n=2 Tax=candidate division MSBL1 TaxID=215777 RepID=A0A133V0Y2_9EURY|nr:hypothetical protein AKJ42_01680 [candidate division MSBL1 archaeon SCGC-AAA261C02]KXB03232.1 hypothetical protein AKJ47_02630 [candidate division MSBL1 archaeon SCGC-AAA261G05]